MPPQPWKTLTTREIYQNKWMRLREDIAEMPNGKTTLYGVCEFGQCVAVLPFVDDKNVVMVRQYRYPTNLLPPTLRLSESNAVPRSIGDLMTTLTQRISGLEQLLQKVALVIGRLALAYLFFTQLWWKTPPTFGCPDGFVFKEGTVDANRQVKYSNHSSGLCDWIGIESVWANAPHPLLVANLDNKGPAEISVDLGFLARGNGAFIDAFVKPNIRWFGYAVWGMEAFIFVSLFFGIFSRLGGLVAIAQSLQLWIGLAGISNPNEWEWSYNWMPVLAFLAFAFAPGRVLGVDALLRPAFKSAAEKGNKLAQALHWLT